MTMKHTRRFSIDVEDTLEKTRQRLTPSQKKGLMVLLKKYGVEGTCDPKELGRLIEALIAHVKEDMK
jgi:hypothetical protein